MYMSVLPGARSVPRGCVLTRLVDALRHDGSPRPTAISYDAIRYWYSGFQASVHIFGLFKLVA